MTNHIIRSIVRETLLLEGEEERRRIKDLATKISSDVDLQLFQFRNLGRKLKKMWQEEADISSFKKGVFVHWNEQDKIINMINAPRKNEEISVLPYKGFPVKKFTLGWDKTVLGLLVKGHPTLVANADLNSNIWKKEDVIRAYSNSPPKEKEIRLRFIDQRLKSSGWNKYPGEISPGVDFDKNDKPREGIDPRSWESHLIYSLDEIAPGEKINWSMDDLLNGFDDTGKPVKSWGWPEALIDNWSISGIIIPKNRKNEQLILKELKASFKTSVGLPIYDVNGTLLDRV